MRNIMNNIKKNKKQKLLLFVITLTILPILSTIISCVDKNNTISSISVANARKVANDKAKFVGFSQTAITGRTILPLGPIESNVIGGIDSRSRPPQATSGVTRTFEVIEVDSQRGKVKVRIIFNAGTSTDSFTYEIKSFAKTPLTDAQKVAKDKAKFVDFSQTTILSKTILPLGLVESVVIDGIASRNRLPQSTLGVTRIFKVINVDSQRGKVKVKITFNAGIATDSFIYDIRDFAKTPLH